MDLVALMLVWFSKKFKQRRQLLILSAIALLIFLGLFTLNILWFAHRALLSDIQPGLVEVVPGTSFTQFANHLMTEKIIDKSGKRKLVLLAKISGNAGRMHVGEYAITQSTTPWQLINKISQGLVVQHKVTFPEGITFDDMRKTIDANPAIKHEFKNMSRQQIRQQLGITADSIEGVFYPDTYLFPRGTSDKIILSKALNKMRKIVAEEWQQRGKKQPYQTGYEALIAASLIEKETAKDQERFLIATVIANRLRLNMLLQIDPTVIYGMGSEYRGRLLRSDLKYESPYNTYLNRGLPPSPIALASRKSIHAALHPLETENLYYVARSNGSHIFANTLSDHIENIQFVKRQRKLEASEHVTQ